MEENIPDVKERVNNGGEYLQSHFERRNSIYELIPANTPELKKIFYEIRYLVYCTEYGFIKKNPYTKVETDKYDEASSAFLLFYTPLHMAIGGIRLVLPDLSKENFGLPILDAENSPFLKVFNHDISKFAEISRFLLSKTRLDLITKHEGHQHDYPLYPSPLHYITRSMFVVCQKHELDGFIAAMSPLFIRLARRMGLILNLVGEPFEYYGLQRQCVYFLVKDYAEWAPKNDTKSYNFINDALTSH